MREIIFLIEDAGDGGFIAKGLDYGIYTEADTIEELRENIRDTVNCHFDENEEKTYYGASLKAQNFVI